MNDAKLVKRATGGDGKALEKLLIKHSDQLYRTAYLYVGNQEDALDAVQEAACRICRTVSQLKKEQYFLTWITRILINCCYEILKKRRREVAIAEADEKAEAKQMQSEVHLDLVQAINQLNDKGRTAIILFYYYDQTIREVAQTMDMPENTVKTVLRRAKECLKKSLGGKADHEQDIV
jgi:RNA polymerase sigma-70 factor (ECF subfamily)